MAIIASTILGAGAGALGIAQAVSGAVRHTATQSPDAGGRIAQAPGSAQTAGDDPDQQVRGSDAERAGQAAVDAVGGGRVVAVEREDETGVAWEVELAQADGTQVEVDLNQDFQRVAVDRDDDRADDDSAADDDVGEARDSDDDD
jgi:hypothetical protein